ncbi:pathogen-related protein-like isoform X1 [Dendrobium catenatum]|uniref:Pathogen-related protein n=1 Tax=Dendrobium catenatum TaxID=906689 RepID=A0A2I0VJP9_9ASPA|nr:pathogen-related protein-like isoform X1 [Dendrobium catenatum]PKU63637.1 Pathogen-related protein [Dendrobium catenatum]
MGSEDKYRSFIYGDGEKNTQWRFGSPPNYDVVNKLFEEGRTHEWAKGSSEEKVQRLVKTFEMEIFHKSNPEDYKIINSTKFRFSLNGGKELTIQEIGKMGGGYNAFLQTKLPKELRIYDPKQETFSTSHELFTTVFPRGFALEILEVLSGPPRIVYKFRHWGFMEGPFKGHAPTGEKVEVYGMSIFHVDEEMRVEKVEFFHDPSQLLSGFLKGPLTESSVSTASASCPFLSAGGAH